MATIATDVFGHLNKQDKYSVFIAEDEYTKNLCYKLRSDVFSKEINPNISNSKNTYDKDRFDDHCHHLVVYDNAINDIVGTTRLLNNEGRNSTGIFYSETEFNLKNILNLDINFIEVGKICIHPAYQCGAVLAVLWHGIAEIVANERIDYLMGCASMPLRNGDTYINSVMGQVFKNHYAPDCLRVTPHIPLRLDNYYQLDEKVSLPALLKTYLRQGGLICGRPYLDAAVGVASLFVLLEASKITNRFSNASINRIQGI